jgi:UDP-2-acetamido-3-amino-2,3-dideoxy-glucuronate N-acetyltransferase
MNVALIGCGAWGKNLARVLYDKRVLHTVCDVAKATLDHYTDVTYRNNYSDVIKDETVDVVVISTPAIYHFDMVMRAL